VCAYEHAHAHERTLFVNAYTGSPPNARRGCCQVQLQGAAASASSPFRLQLCGGFDDTNITWLNWRTRALHAQSTSDRRAHTWSRQPWTASGRVHPCKQATREARTAPRCRSGNHFSSCSLQAVRVRFQSRILLTNVVENPSLDWQALRRRGGYH
jgi:hypothetical protein